MSLRFLVVTLSVEFPELSAKEAMVGIVATADD